MCIFISHTGNIQCVFWFSSFWGYMAALTIRGQDYNRFLIEIWWRLHALLLLLCFSLTVQEVEEPHEKDTGRGHTHAARIEDIRILACAVHQHAWEMQKENQRMNGCKTDDLYLTGIFTLLSSHQFTNTNEVHWVGNILRHCEGEKCKFLSKASACQM